MMEENKAKYRITDIPHPKYPWLHRIQALTKVNEQMEAGDFGGYVESTCNLSQEGSCWIHDNAICCEKAAVEKDARLFDDTCVKGSALCTGDAVMFDMAVAEGNCCIRSGELKEHARVAGNAVIGESLQDDVSPLIKGHSQIYGVVRGGFIIEDVVLPGETLVNPTTDIILLEHGKRQVLIKEKAPTPPKGYRGHPAKKKAEQER